MLDDVTEWKSDRISQKVAGRRLYGMIYEIPLIVTAKGLQTGKNLGTSRSATREKEIPTAAPIGYNGPIYWQLSLYGGRDKVGDPETCPRHVEGCYPYPKVQKCGPGP